MREKIIISCPKIYNIGKNTRLEANIKLKNETYSMYFQTEIKYGEFFTTEVSDAYLVCLLLYAMENEYDMVFEGAISEPLYVQINEYLIPAITRNIKNYREINISCQSLVNIKFEPYLTATGISCGVDSFYTVLKNIKHSRESQLNINALTFFNAGASGDYGGARARSIFEKRSNLARKVAEELNCEFIKVDSNMNEFLNQNHEQTHVFRTLSIPLALQKLFKNYYFSSGMEYNNFRFEYFDPAFYDVLTMPLLSTPNTKFILVGGETTRIGKVKFISEYEIVQKHLNVCVADISNCSKCSKCKRTILNLYLIDKLEYFDNVFDLKYFYKNKKKFIRWAVARKNAIDMEEIVKGLKSRREINVFDYIYAFMVKLYLKLRGLLSKLKRRFKRKNVFNK